MIGTTSLNQAYLTSTDVKYGDIFLIDFDGAKFSEQCGKRPAIVVSNDKGDQHSPTMLVVPLTTKNKKNLPTHLTIEPENSGLKEISTALFEQVKVADKKRIIKKMGHVDNSLIEKIKKGLTIAFGIC